MPNRRIPILALVLLVSCVLAVFPVRAFQVLGNEEGALVGNDLSDLGPILFASSKAQFGQESAFDCFDNSIGESADKWYSGPFVAPQYVGILLPLGYQLTSFTVTSANDVPDRDPTVWRIEGSNDTTTGHDGTWTTIYSHATGGRDWATRQQVNLYSPATGDPLLTTTPFRAFRMVILASSLSSGIFQLDEIELFGLVDTDGDGLPDTTDNCPATANPDQANADGDSYGDVCDSCTLDPRNDLDADGRCADVDNCPAVANVDQADADSDGIGDACDSCTLVTHPTESILQPVSDQFGSPPLTNPITVRLASTDSSLVAREVLKLEGCLLYDGSTLGDRDGLLSDESIQLTRYTLCQAMTRCGYSILNLPKLVAEATDCAQGTSTASRVIRSRLLRTEVCGR